MALRRVRKELADWNENPVEYLSGGPIKDDMFHWEVKMIGPPQSPYKDVVFVFDIQIPQDYPWKPPKITCKIIVISVMNQALSN